MSDLPLPWFTNTPAWFLQARCRGVGPEVFYEDDDRITEGNVRAKALCAQCPVIDLCLAHALKQNEKFGVWGGCTERERRRIRRRYPANHWRGQ